MSSSHKSSLLRAGIVTISVLAATLTTGCANMATTATPVNSFAQPGTLAGRIHGGNQPISGATVNLYAAGSTGYGTGSALLATTTSANDGFGSFAFTQVSPAPGTLGASYACPAANSLLYVVASGGNTVGTGTNNNSASVMMATFGACSTASTKSVNINEISTVASVFALAQYIFPGTSTPASFTIGTNGSYTGATPPQAGIGLKNAFAGISNLANQSAGTAVASNTLTGTGPQGANVTVTATPETAKILTIANILASCVNTTSNSSPNCQALFANAVPPAPAVTSQPGATFPTAAVDTLQAAYFMATNPVDGDPAKLANLYNLQAAAGAPFGGGLSTAPTDWTIGIAYNSGATTCANGALFINYPYANSVDANGNIWMANGGSATIGALTQMSPTGIPLNCSDKLLLGSRGGAAIDTAGNVWGAASATGSTNIIRFDGTTTTAFSLGTGAKPYAIAADGKGNIFATDSANLKLFELAGNAASGTAPTLIGTVTGSSPFNLAVDSKGTVIVGQSGSGGSTITAYPTSIVGGSSYPASGTSITSSSNYAGVYDVAFTGAGSFWVANSAGTLGTSPGNTTSETTLAYSSVTPGDPNTVTFTPGTPTAVFAGGLSTPRNVAIDGAGNIWFANNATASTSGGATAYAVSEFTKTGVAISPTSAGATTQNGGFQKAAAFFNGLRGMAIDPSGNVWTSVTNSTTNTTITEIIGAAVPVVTPISAQLANGTVATKP